MKTFRENSYGLLRHDLFWKKKLDSIISVRNGPKYAYESINKNPEK